MIKLTPALKKQITNDWAQAFPGLGVYKQMHMLRRVGPIVLGICLNRSAAGTTYRPIWHIHLLLKEDSALSLNLAMHYRSKNGSVSAIPVQWHANRFAAAVERMRTSALLPMEGDVYLSQVLDAYERWMKEPGNPVGSHNFEDRVLLCAWMNRLDAAAYFLREAEDWLRSRPDYMRERFGNIDEWLERVRQAASNRQELERILKVQVIAHKLDKLPTSEMLP